MEPRLGKRSRGTRSSGPRKRNRTQSSNAEVVSTGRRVNVNELRWKDVEIPEGFEDAEGFLGLEEIDDIAVRRNADDGAVEFVQVSQEPTDGASSLPQADSEDEEWQGISDGDAGPTNVAVNGRIAQDLSPTRGVEPSQQSERELHPDAVDGIPGDGQQGPSKASTHHSEWSSMGLSETIMACLIQGLGFTKPTPIQKAAIPDILKGRDVIGKAPTGSGKTLAYGIPILESFLTSRLSSQTGQDKAAPSDSPPMALILSPTRELAHQLGKHLGDLVEKLQKQRPRVATVTGGLSLQKQQRLLAIADIVIGTPGRLWDVLSSAPGIQDRIQQVRFLVVDEADRLLNEGHYEEVEKILQCLDGRTEGAAAPEGDALPEGQPLTVPSKPQRQTLVFSATFQRDLQRKLAGRGKFLAADNLLDTRQSMAHLLRRLRFREAQPKFLDVNPVAQMAAGLQEGIVECGALERDLYMYAVLLHQRHARALVFTNSIASVRRLHALLRALALPAHALHSDLPQKARLRAVERFSADMAAPSPTSAQGPPSTTPPPPQHAAVLVATDVAARGLDLPAVDLVLHYHVPRAADAYVHRAGRTARADRPGASVLLCAPAEVVPVRRLTAKVHAPRGADNGDAADGAAGRDSGSGIPKAPRSPLRVLHLDRAVVARLRPRVQLAKRIADAEAAREKRGLQANWLRTAAAELGVEYDAAAFDGAGGSGKARGMGRQKRAQAAADVGAAELAGLRAELREMLARRVNVGVSERYLTAGGVDVDGLLRGDDGVFLGRVDPLSFD